MGQDQARHHVVLIDDSTDILLLVSTMLEGSAWTMEECDDAAKAIECIHDKQPDVVLLDLRLKAPLSGWDIVRELKADSTTAALPIILFTADVQAVRGKEEWLKQLGVGVLVKPFELDDLYRILESAIQTNAMPVAR
jgi:two-component system, OmpR family, phosphate regulon response regulator PhoB